MATNGWLSDSGISVVPFIKSYREKGVAQVISTDISTDGTLAGPALDLYRNILSEVPDIYLIASGGVGSVSDIEALDGIGVPAVIVGKAIYEGRISFKDIEKLNTVAGLC